MALKIDPAILKALSLDAATTTIASHGGSGFASTFKITSKGTDGEEKLYFVKQGSGRESEVMFAGIFSPSLIKPILCQCSKTTEDIIPNQMKRASRANEKQGNT
jgi:hypothetical protein